MKRIAVLLLAVLIVMNLVGCSSEEPKTATDAAVEFLDGIKEDPSSLSAVLQLDDERLEVINRMLSKFSYEIIAESDTDRENVKDVVVRFSGYDIGRYMELYLNSQEASLQKRTEVQRLMRNDGYSEEFVSEIIYGYIWGTLNKEDSELINEYLARADQQVYEESMTACRRAGKTYDSGNYPVRVFNENGEWLVSKSYEDLLDAMTNQLYTLMKRYHDSTGQ